MQIANRHIRMRATSIKDDYGYQSKQSVIGWGRMCGDAGAYLSLSNLNNDIDNMPAIVCILIGTYLASNGLHIATA